MLYLLDENHLYWIFPNISLFSWGYEVIVCGFILSEVSLVKVSGEVDFKPRDVNDAGWTQSAFS